MALTYETYPFTPILGWSISRYEVFDKCRRQYFYAYYSKHVKDVPVYKVKQLKEMTSVPLEIGNVVHDVMEAFLRRLQKSDSGINEQRFFDFAAQKAAGYFSAKTFIETYYSPHATVDMAAAAARIKACLANFINSPCYHWLFMKAMTNRFDWMIEPAGYGETRLDGLKAYCKMDFLFPVDGCIHILDWKTGKKNTFKHSHQLMGYAAAASANFGIPREAIFPKIVYLYPEFSEYELSVGETDFASLFDLVRRQTEEMYRCCKTVEENIPLPIEEFPMSPSLTICGNCNYRELCFPESRGALPAEW